MIQEPDLQKIVKEKNLWSRLSDRNREVSNVISEDILISLLSDNFEVLNDSWEIQADLRSMEYEMIARVAMIKGNDYDSARRSVIGFSDQIDAKMGLGNAIASLKQILFGEQKNVLKRFLVDECNVNKNKLEDVIKRINNIDELRLAAESISKNQKGASSVDYSARIRNWENNVEGLARKYFYTFDMERKLKLDVIDALYSDENVKPLIDTVKKNELYDLVTFIFLKTSNVPRLKDLSRPTIVLVGGTSGTGKSTISQHVTRNLNIPVYSSTDVIAREVVRNIMSWTLGNENARSTFPELFGSSFEGSDLSWYYSHSILTMIGVIGAIERLVKDGTSAVIEGVPLIPGILPERFFDMANIVWIVSSIDNEKVHYSRYSGRDKAGVSRGGSERYMKRFEDIRTIHDRISLMAETVGALKLDNSGDVNETLSFALDRVKDPFADKGLRIKDDIRDRSFFQISQRRTHLDMEINRDIGQSNNLRSYSNPDLCGPSLNLVEEALSLWISHRKDKIKSLEKKLTQKKGKMEQAELELISSQIEHCRRDVHLAVEDIKSNYILELLRNNFEYLRATRSLLIQLRSLQVNLLTRLSSVPGINYDDARSEVYRIFKQEGKTTNIESSKLAIKDLMFRELVHNIKGFLESEYNIDGVNVDQKMEGITDLMKLRLSLDFIVDGIFLVKTKRELSKVQISNVIAIWEKNLDNVIEKNFEIFIRWRDLEDTEMELLHNDLSMIDLKEKITKEELHRLVRWITPRLYDVPKVKDLEKRPTLILVNGTLGSGRSFILNRVSNLLSIPTCFTSSIIDQIVIRTIGWLFGEETTQRTFPALCTPSDKEPLLEVFYERAVLSIIAIRGALDRLIKENTSAVIIGDSLIPSMLEESYYENSNIIGMVTSGMDEDNNFQAVRDKLVELARCGHTLIVENAMTSSSLELVHSKVTSPYSDRGLPVNDDLRDHYADLLERRRNEIASDQMKGYKGAILTDIDDTLILSGVTPDEKWISSFSRILRSLSLNNILWAPMSGVALTKLGKRLLYRLPIDTLSNIVAYLGDGSSKHKFDMVRMRWVSDPGYLRELNDTQSIAVVGTERYLQDLHEISENTIDHVQFKSRIEKAVREIEEYNGSIGPDLTPIDPQRGLIGELEDILNESGLPGSLKDSGHIIESPETYFRGGSVSWMMLGDISTEPYDVPESILMRKGKLIPYAERRLEELNSLLDLGQTGVHVPFPGARGIKFVLMGNDKERGARDLIESYNIPDENVIFIGNELFEGGNDNMLRNIQGINLISVGTKEDPGSIKWGAGVGANWSLMEKIVDEFNRGFSFKEMINRLKSADD